MHDWMACAGCGLAMPRESGEPSGKAVASVACERVYGEISGYALEHPPLDRWHQLGIDTYDAQHTRADAANPRPFRLAHSLVGLYLTLEHGCTGEQVRSARVELGTPDLGWPCFFAPDPRWDVTVMDVAERGLMSDSASGHAVAFLEWAQSVWVAWDPLHQAVADFTRERLPGLFPARVTRCWGYR